MTCLIKAFNTLGVFIDLSKAFDTIDHKILLKKRSHYGLKKACIGLLVIFLTGNSLYVAMLTAKPLSIIQKMFEKNPTFHVK